MAPYKTYSDVYHHGNHLEHIHTYYASLATKVRRLLLTILVTAHWNY